MALQVTHTRACCRLTAASGPLSFARWTVTRLTRYGVERCTLSPAIHDLPNVYDMLTECHAVSCTLLACQPSTPQISDGGTKMWQSARNPRPGHASSPRVLGCIRKYVRTADAGCEQHTRAVKNVRVVVQHSMSHQAEPWHHYVHAWLCRLRRVARCRSSRSQSSCIVLHTSR